jgi:putative oxidoreductase
MPTDFVSVIIFIARLLMGGAFLVAGIRNFTRLDKLTGLMASRGVPQAGPVTMAGVALQTVSGALVAIGVLTSWAALGEAVFLIAATAIVHPYWTYPAEERFPHINACITNTALIGGFLLLFAVSL